jgi:hypothetical protein
MLYKICITRPRIETIHFIYKINNCLTQLKNALIACMQRRSDEKR